LRAGWGLGQVGGGVFGCLGVLASGRVVGRGVWRGGDVGWGGGGVGRWVRGRGGGLGCGGGVGG